MNKLVCIMFALLIGVSTALADVEIRTWDDLQNMQNDLEVSYVLMNSLTSDTEGYSNYSTGSGFSPIGSYGNEFVGGFDGQGYVIDGLYINRPALDSVGLFGYTDRNYSLPKSSISNVGLLNVDIIGGYRTGGLAGRSASNISKCFVTGTVTGEASNSLAAGLAAQSHGVVENCFAQAYVSAVYSVAGLIEFNNGTINACYSTGEVSGGANYFGGLVAEPAGHGGGVLSSSFWDVDTSGTILGAGTGKTTVEMKTLSTYTDIGTEGLSTPWDFDDVWVIDSAQEYPSFQNTVPEPAAIGLLGLGGLLTLLISRLRRR